MTRRVVIVGGGPAGCTTGLLLARAGARVTIIDRGVRPRLIVGESLIPSVVMKLRELGLEDRVSKIGILKPGAAIAMEGDFDWSLSFPAADGPNPNYAYNVHRAEFDALFQEVAKEAGCTFLRERAVLRAEGDRLLIDSPDVGHYDFVVDASGRSRYAAKVMGIRATRGTRSDTALFSHFDRAELPYGNAIHMTVFEDGWSWRIPLRGRVSVGFVLEDGGLKRRGKNRQEQFSNLVKEVPILSSALTGATQIEELFEYQNYQLTSDRMVGENWAMVGDAAGFVDPVFSSGVSLALDGAFDLVETLTSNRLASYEKNYRRRLQFWQKLVATFYDTSFINLIRCGSRLKAAHPEAFMRLGGDERVAAMMSGVAVHDAKAEERYYDLLRFVSFSERTSSAVNQ